MDPNAPRPDAPEGEGKRPLPVAPDPHVGEALPEPESGLRPGVDPTVVRPEQDEPGGPLAGLVGAGAAQTADAATPDGAGPSGETLASMGVEEEGIESGQLLGFVAATLVAVGLLAFALIYFIYAPFRENTDARASNVALYTELEQTRVDARAKLDQTALGADSVYRIPIGRAMGLVAAEYGAGASAPSPTRSEFNTVSVNRTAGRAVQSAQAASAAGTAATDTGAARPTGSASRPAGAYNPADPPSAPVPRTLNDGQEQAATPGP